MLAKCIRPSGKLEQNKIYKIYYAPPLDGTPMVNVTTIEGNPILSTVSKTWMANRFEIVSYLSLVGV